MEQSKMVLSKVKITPSIMNQSPISEYRGEVKNFDFASRVNNYDFVSKFDEEFDFDPKASALKKMTDDLKLEEKKKEC